MSVEVNFKPEVDKFEMETYMDIQKNGGLNMMSAEVRNIIGIDRGQHKHIIMNYDELKKHYKL